MLFDFFYSKQLENIGRDITELKKLVSEVIIYQRYQTKRIQSMAINVEALRAEVAEVATVEASAVALINGIADRIAEAVAAATSDPAAQAAIDELVSSLKASTEALSAAVAANTPAAPAVQPEPPTE